MLRRLFQTDDNWAVAVIRVVLGSVVFAQEAQKMLGWFGGCGFHGYVTYLMEGVKGASPVVILSENFWRSHFGAAPRIGGSPITPG